MDYKDYLKTDYWKERKNKFKNKTHKRCFICRSKLDLQVHHKRYSRKGISILFNERHQDLRLLCSRCHNYIHKHHLERVFASNLMKRRELRDLILSTSDM